MVSDISLAGRETDALHRLVEEELPGLRILGQVDDGVEESVEHQLGRTAANRHLEGGPAGARPGGLEVYGVRLGRPSYRRIRRFVERQLDGLATGDRHDVDVVVALDVGAEGEPFTVGGDEGRVLHARHRDDGRGLPAPDRNGIDVAVIAEVYLFPVRGKRRM